MQLYNSQLGNKQSKSIHCFLTVTWLFSKVELNLQFKNDGYNKMSNPFSNEYKRHECHISMFYI